MNHKHRVQRIKDILWRTFLLVMFLIGVVILAYNPEPAQAAFVPTPCNITDVMLPEFKPIGKCFVTGYDPRCSHCCGKTDAITASGVKATIGKTVAAYGLPFGTKLYISGLGYFTVEDRGVGRGVIDIAVSSHSLAYAITGMKQVYLVE